MTAFGDEPMVWYGPPRPKMVGIVIVVVVFAGMSAASLRDILLESPSTRSPVLEAMPLGLFGLCAIFAALWARSVRVGLGGSSLVYRSLFGSTTIPLREIVTISRFWRRGTEVLRIRTAEEWITLSTVVFTTEDLNTIGRSLVVGCPQAVVEGRKRLCSN
jgi:hypothetical protein